MGGEWHILFSPSENFLKPYVVLMNFKPKKALTDQEVKKGLSLVIGDGLAAEAMITFTSGAFLIAMALLIGASNFQIGLLAALPTFTNIFQLISIWLVRKFHNRKAVTVLSTILARVPLVIIGSLLLLFPEDISVNTLIVFLFFHFFFGSIAGPSWNSWIKDIVPHQSLGAYFSRRTSYTQALNVVLSVMLALTVDYIKNRHQEYELLAYAIMFALAGIVGIIGAVILSRVSEPQTYLARENIFRLLKRPLQDTNFVRLLTFNSAWVFALNIATPFFTVYMMKSMQLSLSYIIGLTVISQLFGIFTVRIWGAYADKYSNKTIIAILAPLYILCMIAWCFVGIYTRFYANLGLLVVIHIFTGISTAGVNLSLTNIGLKLAPSEDAIVYLSARNIITAFFSSIAPLIGGSLADYFENRSLVINAEWTGPALNKVLHLLSLHEWTFVFLIGALMALLALELLIYVNETGEVEKGLVRRIMRKNLRITLKDYFIIGNLIGWHDDLWTLIRRKASRLYFRKPHTPS
jgi:MFS family permease